MLLELCKSYFFLLNVVFLKLIKKFTFLKEGFKRVNLAICMTKDLNYDVNYYDVKYVYTKFFLLAINIYKKKKKLKLCHNENLWFIMPLNF